MRVLFLLLSFLWTVSLPAQQKHTISGYITDAQTGERLFSATVYDQQSGIGTMSNRFGYFSITLPEGNLALKFSFVGYKAQTKAIDLKMDTVVSVALNSDNKLDEVIIRGNSVGQRDNGIGHVKLSAKTLAKLPSLMGEKDVMKSLMILPGVQQGSEGSAGIFVRGGTPDQNLILLDDVPLYNVSHLFGLVSVFTPEAINSIDFYKGGYPARYGGRLSSVIDLRMKDGNKYKHETSINFGLLSSQFTTEGPIKKGESSYFISARRTLLDLILRGALALSQRNADEVIAPAYGFHDINGKVNFKLDEKNHLYWSFYSGKDNLSVDYRTHMKTMEEEENVKAYGGMHWGNTMTAFKLNTRVNPRLFMNTTLSGSMFNYGNLFKGSNSHQVGEQESTNKYRFDYHSQIHTLSLKTDFDIYGNSNLPFQVGLFISANNYLPGKQEVSNNDNSNGFSSGRVSSYDYGLYVDKKFLLGNHFTLTAGLRNAMYSIINEKTYFVVEPRLNLTYRIGESTNLQATYAVMTQPIHLLSNGNIGLPTDIWVPSTRIIRPETSAIYSAGFKTSLLPKLKFSIEAYYKTLNHVISFTEGDGIMDVNKDWEQKVTSGKGRCWGIENELRFTNSKVEGWIGYTRSNNERKFTEINQNHWFPFQYDRPHKIDFGVIWQLNNGWSSTAIWTYQTGVPATYSGLEYPGISSNYNFRVPDDTGNPRIQYSPTINGVRLPDYHRLDLGVTKEWDAYGKKRALSISIYNAYGRKNPYLVYAKIRKDGTTGLKQLTLFPIIPSVSYRISF